MIIRLRDEPKCLRTQCQVQNETQIRRNETIVEKNRKLEVKNYPRNKKQTINHQQLKFKPPKCPSCKRIIG